MSGSPGAGRTRDTGWPRTFLSAGFRPFFLLAGLAAVVVMGRMVLVLAGHAPGPPGGLVAWHGHEMLFGFVAAAMAGFLLTAIPSWTDTEPVSGVPLAALAGLWVAARGGLWAGAPAPWAVAADLAFLPAVALVATRPLWGRGQPRAWLPLGVFLAVAAANGGWHLGQALEARVVVERALGFATMSVALMIAVIGGRIIPAFTRNQMRAAGASNGPRAEDRRDLLAVAASAAVALGELAYPPAVAALAGAAALAHGGRLVGWRGAWAMRDPLLFVLHVGYFWLAVGYGVRALAPLGPPWAGAWALHGILVGAAGSMILAVMSRATLGHTGRPLRAGPVLSLAFGVLQGAVLARLGAAWLGPAAWSLAGLLWCAAFALFALRCGPMLLRPRVVPAPGAVPGAVQSPAAPCCPRSPEP